MGIDLRHGDCLDVMAGLDEASIDSIVTDPPYELGFMGRKWDASGVAFDPRTWAAALRVLKPGGHMFAFSGTRTYHRMVCAIEDAGFEIRDQFAWVYGQGFPKSLDVSKAIDKAAGATRPIVGQGENYGKSRIEDGKVGYGDYAGSWDITAPATPEAAKWKGWGTAAKPAWEPICLARKPLSEKTVAANVLAHGTGALNIDKCRVGMMTPEEVARSGKSTKADGWGMAPRSWKDEGREPAGRWPANLVHDGSDEVLAAFPNAGGGYGKRGAGGQRGIYSPIGGTMQEVGYGDSGSAARFFYQAKASAKDRAGSKHPTVKPIALMRWLVRLITPPGGIVLDPFAGSGTTGEAARLEGFNVTLIEREDEYMADIKRRLNA